MGGNEEKEGEKLSSVEQNPSCIAQGKVLA